MDLLPEQRRSLGRSLFVAGLVAMASSGMVMYKLSSTRALAATRFTESSDSCKARLSALGGEISDAPGRIVWLKKDLNDAPARLGEASVVSVLCPGWKLKLACMGEQCPDQNAMRVVLEPINADPNL